LVEGSPNIRFYAGVQLVAPNNQRLGSLCAISTKPRVLKVHRVLWLCIQMQRRALTIVMDVRTHLPCITIPCEARKCCCLYSLLVA
jgi:hypothetical protein